MLSAAAEVHAAGPVLDLDTLSGAQAEQMMQAGTLTSVELTEDYLARIAALNKAGPGLNAVTQIDPDALQEAAQADSDRAAGVDLGPAMGLPILLKDIIDAAPMTTTAGDYALRGSYAPDSGVAKELKAHGVVILGKTGLSEWANSFGHNPNGFSNLLGQVLNANDTGQDPSGSSSGSASAADSGLASLTIGTETSGSIISPATAQSDVGLRPTVGLVPGYGIAPIDVSQDTAGPIERTVSDAAMTLQSIAEVPGSDPTANQEYLDVEGPNYLSNGDVPAPPSSKLPNYLAALTTSFVNGKRIGYNGTCTGYPACTGTVSTAQAANDQAVTALANAGAIMVPDPTTTLATQTALPSGYEAHATIDDYYKGIDPLGFTPANLAQEISLDNNDPQESEKYSNSTHVADLAADDSTITAPSSPTATGVMNADLFQTILPLRKLAYHSAIDAMLNCPGEGTTTNATETLTIDGTPTTVNDGSTTCPASPAQAPVIAIIGSVGGSSPGAGYPEMVVPFGYSPTQRRNIGVDITSGAYDEFNIIGVGYVLEQATQLRQPAADVNPAAYRCADTVPAEPFASRGHCNPDEQSVMSMLGGTQTILPFPLETTSASTLEAMMKAGTLTSQQLVEAYLTRIALANANGPAIQAIRAINPNVLRDAAASDSARAAGGAAGPLTGIPVLIDDSMNAVGMATSGGSIALEDSMPAADATLVAKLKAAGAIILGDTNTTELNGAFDPNMIQGYSSLGGQVLLPSDTDRNIGGSSAGSAAAVAAGFAALSVGMETTTDATPAGTGGAQLIAPAGNAGVVGLKPTVGLISTSGVLPVAESQDSPGPIGETVTDVANELNGLVSPVGGPYLGAQTTSNYAAGLSSTALSSQKIAVLSTATPPGNAVPYPAAVTEIGTLGATTTTFTTPTPPATPSIVPYELHQGIDTFLGTNESITEPNTLQQVIDYDNANPVEGLKFGQNGLLAAEAVSTADPATTSAYQSNLAAGQSAARADIDGILSAGGDAAIMVPSGSALVGIADRAGYPVLTVPAGYGPQTGTTGSDPFGVDFIGTANSEAELLDDGYAFEQGTNARLAGPPYLVSAATPNPSFSGAPSETNQSMWRCVPGSAFYHPYLCNPGDLESPTCLDGTQSGCPTTTPPALAPVATPPTVPTTPPASTKTTPPPAKFTVKRITAGHGLISVEFTCPAGGRTCSDVVAKAVVIETIRVSGSVLAIASSVEKATITRTVTIGRVASSAAAGKTKTVKLELNKTGLTLLAKSRHGLPTRLTVTLGGKTVKTKVLTVEKVTRK
ncbi:MAG TPA: amidase family protein [Solirubrobacteraceae bacterium]|jgi:Asp-tRNA(Asn)/Glu-tRNA(Gln) amidotransferase A subunit family amidase|nr:amidase family protein [Solirubrobacteraceae bacterium]